MKLNDYTFSIPNADKHLNVNREQLPQIPSKKMPEFLAYLKANKVPFGKAMCKPSKLKPVQKHINKDKIKVLMTTNKSDLKKPIIVGRGGYVIDGHHRWLAYHALYGDKPMSVIFIDDDIPGLVKIANDFEHSTNKTIKEGDSELKKVKSKRSKMETFDRYLAKKIIKELDYSVAHLYDPANYNDAQTAYKELQKLNTKLNKTKKITMKQVQNFLRNVYKSGDHQVSKKDFIRTLLNDGVKIVNRSDRLCPSGYTKNTVEENIKIEIRKILNNKTI